MAHTLARLTLLLPVAMAAADNSPYFEQDVADSDFLRAEQAHELDA